ncbi:DegT/DnrJ/EryC1/StrS family aminotransferase [Lachnospiraceae bacterium 62-26]
MDNINIFVTKTSMPPYQEYIEAIKPLWESHWITNMGQYHEELEKKLSAYLDVQELSLMVNGHMALELAIQAFDFPEDSEVITTPFTFISTTHAIVRNHLQPVFCDVKICDGTMDETKIENLITEKTVAILPVHVYGNVCNVDKIQRIAEKYRLKVIYDAAHAFGVRYRGKGIGNYGDASIFSFHATKIFNTIEGGAVAFSEHELYDKLYNLKNFGIQGEETVVSIGANAKMNEFSAIMGLCNLEHIAHVIQERKKRWELYKEKLNHVHGIQLFIEKQDETPNYAYFPILVKGDRYGKRDEVYQYLREKNIYLRKYFYPLTSDQTCFKNKYKKTDLNNARCLAEQVLVLPLYPEIEEETVAYICQMIAHVLKE